MAQITEATHEGFAPVARYYSAMDLVMYLREDCSYRADRVDMWLTLLWHPYEDVLVGIKLKGVRFLFDRVKQIVGLRDDDFLPLVSLLEAALVGGMTESALEGLADGRMEKLYEQAREIARDVRLPATELRRVAA